ncbi:hypothetical protein L1987_13730 [Smallanthus sonchifolius]|uniref:Uncharacterized protein n=1 Tax=Smallanthus sonchifolius TaxID=185202 RepID=A0ACB9JH94_9ASTR|nr:hypothetical protein L1987_13730 [Smallanthus sonchifolius]
MLGRRDLGFFSLVFLAVVVVVPVIVFVLRRKWRQSVARSEEVKRLLVSVSEESARVDFEAREAYYYTATFTPSARVSVCTPTYDSVPLKTQYQCAVCFCPTTTRCAKCKAVRYCSGKCQIVHWRQGHKDECHPYVAANPINNVGSSSNRQGDHKDHNDSFDTEAKQTATPAESKSPLSYEGHSVFSTPTKFSAGATFEAVKSAHQTSVSPARKSTGLGDNNQKIYSLSDEDTQPGISSSLFRTDDGSNESSLSEPSTNSFGFRAGSNCDKKPATNEHVDFAPGTVGEDANGYMAKHTKKFVSNSNIMNGFSADILGVTGLGSKKSNDLTDSSMDMVHDSSRMLTHRDVEVGSDPISNFRETKKSTSSVASLHASAAGYSTFKDDKAYGGLPSSVKSNDVFSKKSMTPDMSKSREVVSSGRHISHSTKSLKVDIDNKRVTTCSPQLTKNSRGVRSGSKTSKFKVVDHLKPTILSRQESLEGGCDISHRYSFKGLFPYEMFVKLYNWKQVELKPFGLKNCGNSCYANAVLQCLVYTPPLTAYLLEGLHSKACDKRGWCFTCEFEGLVMKAKDGNSPLTPVSILTHIENIGSNLRHGKEEDAHEFLRYIIDTLQSVCIKEARTNNSFEEEKTLIGLTFGGYLRSKIICMKCGGKSEQNERMMDITVEIEGGIRTLEDALDKFTCTEILDGENKYKCDRCKSYERAKKKLTLLEAPNVLTIALKRFQSGKFGKLNKSIHFPEILDMAPYVTGTSDKSPIYSLYGVVVHVDTMNAAFSGHYVCYVKNLQNRWFKFDDSMVNEVDLQHVLTKGAYMLLYARCSPHAPRSIRSSLIHHHDSRKNETPTLFVSRPHTTEPWDACNYHPQRVHHWSQEEESSSSDNSGFFSESCSCSTESTHRDSSSIEDHISGDWEHDYHRNINLNSSDSDTSSTSPSSSPSPLYSRLSHLYASTTNGGPRVQAETSRIWHGEDDHKLSKVCRNLDCNCNCCSRVTNLDRLDGPGTHRGVTFRKSTTRRKPELKC